MNMSGKTTVKIGTQVLLSTLWIVVMINMAYADILGLFIPGAVEEAAKTAVSIGITITQLMLIGAIMLEIPIAMILLSRVLKFKVNRWANIIAATLFAVTQIYSLFLGVPSPMYIFYTIIEIAGLLLIVWYAWKWPNPEG